jgi:hypothetical protein
VYEEKGKIEFGFRETLTINEKRQTAGGFSKDFGPLYLLVQ